MVHQLFIVLILYNNRVMSSEPFGKDRLESFEEIIMKDPL